MEQNRKKKFHLFLGYGVFALLFLIAEACQEINGPFEDITCFIAVVILFLLISVFIFSIFHRIRHLQELCVKAHNHVIDAITYLFLPVHEQEERRVSTLSSSAEGCSSLHPTYR
ncbi:MAG: hypothetical protein SOX76_05510 [Candidatus Enterosoma sp.]|nr:hypothetical protein [Candidatus Enterosoma sp.]